MRFTILSQYYPPEIGAPQVRLSAFARELKRLGHTVQVVTAMPNYPQGVIYSDYRGKFFVKETVDGISVVRTWIYPATGRNIFKRLLNYFSFTVSCLFALTIIPRADILFVESPPLFLCASAWLIAKLRWQKLCINVSDLWPDSVLALGIMQDGKLINAASKLEKWLYKHAWRICGATVGILQGIEDKGISRAKLLFLPNGVDTTHFQVLPYQYRADEPLLFLYAGTHGYAHGVEVILHAANQLCDRNNIRFLLVGSGADKSRLEALAQKLNLPNLHFREPVPIEDMPNLLAESYAALVTVAGGDFFAGTRSAKIFPAMASGRPILHSGYGEGANLVDEADCGIVTPPGDAHALADAVICLAESTHAAQVYGLNGRKFVEEKFSWRSIVVKWFQQLR